MTLAHAPARTSKAIITRLADEIAGIQSMPDVKERLATQNVEPFISEPEQFDAFIKAEMAKFGRTIKLANIRIEH